MATTATDLAADLGVAEGDIGVMLGLLDEHSSVLSDDVAAFVRQLLDPVGAGYAATSCDLHVLVYEAAESVAS